MPTIVLLPLVPATATPGVAQLTTSASSRGRGTQSIPSARAARISGVSASTAVEYTKRLIAAVTAEPSCGPSSMPSRRSAPATSSFLP